MPRITGETLALGLDGPFAVPTLQVLRSAREVSLAFGGELSAGLELSPQSPAVLVATGPPSYRAVRVVAAERRGDQITIRYRLVPRARLPREVLLNAEERFAVGLAHPSEVSPYHLVQLHGLPAGARFRFERELERSVMGSIELRGGQVILDEDALFAPISPPHRLRVSHGGFEGEVPLTWSASTPGVPLKLFSTPPPGKTRFAIRDSRAAAALSRLRGMLLRVEGVVRRIRGPELIPVRAWLIETGEQVYGQESTGLTSLAS